MNTCKTCKWWKEQGMAYHSQTHMICDYVDNMYNTGSTFFEVHAEALDDSGMDTALVTGPDFGCIHHKTKEK